MGTGRGGGRAPRGRASIFTDKKRRRRARRVESVGGAQNPFKDAHNARMSTMTTTTTAAASPLPHPAMPALFDVGSGFVFGHGRRQSAASLRQEAAAAAAASTSPPELHRRCDISDDAAHPPAPYDIPVRQAHQGRSSGGRVVSPSSPISLGIGSMGQGFFDNNMRFSADSEFSREEEEEEGMDGFEDEEYDYDLRKFDSIYTSV